MRTRGFSHNHHALGVVARTDESREAWCHDHTLARVVVAGETPARHIESAT